MRDVPCIPIRLCQIRLTRSEACNLSKSSAFENVGKFHSSHLFGSRSLNRLIRNGTDIYVTHFSKNVFSFRIARLMIVHAFASSFCRLGFSLKNKRCIPLLKYCCRTSSFTSIRWVYPFKSSAYENLVQVNSTTLLGSRSLKG